MVYYSALHWAKKAEASAKEAAENAQSGGALLQLGFDGSMVNGILEFKHAPGGVETPYVLVDDVEYELDLAFSSTAALSTNTEMVVKNGSDTIRFVSALHREATTNATVADMDAVMRFNSSTGYRWLFKAAYKVTPSGAKVFLLYPVVYKDDSIVKTSGDQTIADKKTFTGRLITTQNGAHQVYNADGATLSSYTLDNARAYRADGVTSWFFVGAQKQNGAYYQRMGMWNDANTDFAAINVGFDSNGNKITHAPTPPASDNSTQIATTAWVNTRLGGTGITSTEIGYLDGVTSKIQTQLNGTVKTSGDQTVAGTKTFTNVLSVSRANDSRVASKLTSYAQGTAPSANAYGGYRFLDKNNVEMGGACTAVSTANAVSSVLYVKSPVASATSTGTLGIYCNSSGSFYTQAPTPTAADNSTKIATTAWVTSNGTKNSFKPNWDGKVSITRGANYTAPSNGFVMFFASDWNKSTTITINGTQLFLFSGNVISGTLGCLPVSKGDIVNITGGVVDREDHPCPTYFIPFK